MNFYVLRSPSGSYAVPGFTRRVIDELQLVLKRDVKGINLGMLELTRGQLSLKQDIELFSGLSSCSLTICRTKEID